MAIFKESSTCIVFKNGKNREKSYIQREKSYIHVSFWKAILHTFLGFLTYIRPLTYIQFFLTGMDVVTITTITGVIFLSSVEKSICYNMFFDPPHNSPTTTQYMVYYRYGVQTLLKFTPGLYQSKKRRFYHPLFSIYPIFLYTPWSFAADAAHSTMLWGSAHLPFICLFLPPTPVGGGLTHIVWWVL